jgi:hypothetical protein
MVQTVELDWGTLQEELSKQLTLSLRLLKELKDLNVQDDEHTKSCKAASKHHFNLYLTHVRMSLKQRHCYSGSYFRNFMWALTTTGCEGGETYEDFLNNFQNPVFVSGNDIIKKDLYTQQQDEQFQHAEKFDRYMQLLVSLYAHKLLNIVHGRDQSATLIEDKRWSELKDLHHKYERESALDEIYMIRTQFIWTIIGTDNTLLKDEGKREKFRYQALDMLNGINISNNKE